MQKLSVHREDPDFVPLETAVRMVLDGLTMKRRNANSPKVMTRVWINAPKGPEKVFAFSGKFREERPRRASGEAPKHVRARMRE